MKKLIAAIFALSLVASCKWKHQGKIIKDAEGNLYRVQASGIISERYKLQILQKSEIDLLWKTN